ncbi:MAG: hypothetical protein CMI31_05430 [Opitutae bacterium]|nr:hypothetical protein [Opitutae bacterium]
MKISQILDKIDDNQLYVPAFQRQYVWKRDHVKALFNSLIKEYPTGTILTWDTNSPPELKGKKQYDKRQGAVKLILDGQQRITSLYMIIRGEIPPYYTEKEIIQDTRNLYVNIETLELQYYKKYQMVNNPLWVNLTDVFQKKVRAHHLLTELKSKNPDTETIDDERIEVIHDNFIKIENIKDRDFLEQSIPIKASIREAIDIFYIVNASGVNLTEAELALAQISGYWPDARKLILKKLFDLSDKGFVFNLDFFVYALLGVIHNIGSDMRKLHSKDNIEVIKAAWKKLDTQILDYVMNIMQSRAYVDHTKEINSVYALIPIIVYAYNKNGKMSEEKIKKAVKWFYYSQIRNRYISTMPQKLDKDIGIVVESENPFDELLGIIKSERSLEIQSDEFVGIGINHPLYSLMRWYFKSRNAVCLTTGISLRKNMGKKYTLEWDHIFPYSLLKENGYNMANRHKYQLAQEITNRAILTQIANRTKSDMEPDEYLKKVDKKALELQSIPYNPEYWKMENFELFLDERRKLLSENLNEFLDGITEMESPQLNISIDELIMEGESKHLEFKSSLRWDYREQRVNKSLEEVVLKTIAAFNNTDGGILVIGVDDDGEFLGLQNDYDSLNGDKDKFQLHLFNLLDAEYGTGYSTSSITVTFHQKDNNEVCKIEISNGDNPLYTNVTDKHGQKSQKFFVRPGNASKELASHSEVTEYINNRFSK